MIEIKNLLKLNGTIYIYIYEYIAHILLNHVILHHINDISKKKLCYSYRLIYVNSSLC